MTAIPLAVSQALPHLEADPAKAYVPLRGSMEGSFGETHLIFATSGRLYAVTKTSALGSFETVELDGREIPRLVVDRWGDSLRVIDLDGTAHAIQLDSLSRDRTLESLGQLYRDHQAWDALAQVLAQRIEASYDTHTRTTLGLELAELQRTLLGQPAEARAVYERILLHEPEHGQALAGLTELFLDGFEIERTGTGLAERHEAMDQWAAALLVREIMVEFIEGPQARLSARIALADAFERRLDDHDRALAAVGAAVCEAPSDQAAWDVMETVGAQVEDAELARDIFACAATVCGDESPEVQARLLQRLGERLLQTGQQGDAKSVFHQLVGLGMPHASPGLQALGALYEARQDWQGLLGVWHAELDFEPALDRQVALWTAIGQTQLHAVGDLTAAETAFTTALSLFAEHLPALEGLRPIYAHQGRHEDQFQLLRRLVDLELRAPERVALVKEMAQLALEQLRDAERAIECWFKVRAIAPDDPDLIEQLTFLLRSAERFEELAGVLADRLGHGGRSVAERDTLRRRLARLYQNELASPARSETVWLSLLDAAEVPDPEALEAMANLKEAGGDRGAAREYLEQLVDVLPEGQSLGVLRRLAALCEADDEPIAALNAWLQIRQQQPEVAEVLVSVARLAALVGEKALAVATQRDLLELPSEERVHGERLLTLVALLRELAEGSQEREILLDEAQACVTIAIHVLPGNVGAARTHVALLEDLERWAELAMAIADELLPLVTDPAERRVLLERALNLARVEVGDTMMGVTLASRFAADVVGHEDLERLAADMAVETMHVLELLDAAEREVRGSIASLVGALTLAAETAHSPGVLTWLGEWYFDHGDTEAAVHCFGDALGFGERTGRALAGFTRTLINAGRPHVVLNRLQTYIDNPSDDGGAQWRAALFNACADAAVAKGDVEQAERYRRQANRGTRILLWVGLTITVLSLVAGAVMSQVL